ncbi:MAG: hypothetical protein CM1200mP10_09320 [Candidatus Neomarinimicrobiota bacterium]|nr:MAG: hypothetical protein CM1200mP10_09320 [Candidatus Neomarinimicrobiota bacterium]
MRIPPQGQLSTNGEGDIEYGYAFSVENVFPYLWYRKGISKRSDIGVRVGLPIYGSGLDYSRLLYKKSINGIYKTLPGM